MTETERPEFVRNLMILAGLYGRKLDELTMESYWKSFKGFTLDQVLDGIGRATNEEKYFPPPAVLRAKMCHREIGAFEALEGPPRARGEHATVAFKLVQAITRTRMPPAKRLESFRYMAKRWPGLGWEEAVGETEAILARQG